MQWAMGESHLSHSKVSSAAYLPHGWALTAAYRHRYQEERSQRSNWDCSSVQLLALT